MLRMATVLGAARRLNHRIKWAELAVLEVHAHLDGCIIRSRATARCPNRAGAVGAEDNLHALHGGRAVRPCAEGVALNEEVGRLLLGHHGRCGSA